VTRRLCIRISRPHRWSSRVIVAGLYRPDVKFLPLYVAPRSAPSPCPRTGLLVAGHAVLGDGANY
jgi:hypothetical protein